MTCDRLVVILNVSWPRRGRSTGQEAEKDRCSVLGGSSPERRLKSAGSLQTYGTISNLILGPICPKDQR